jgi:hypothetical protein
LKLTHVVAAEEGEGAIGVDFKLPRGADFRMRL